MNARAPARRLGARVGADGGLGDSAEGPGRMLHAAGYVYDFATAMWVHPRTRRTLLGRVARAMTVNRLAEWIHDGHTVAFPPRTAG